MQDSKNKSSNGRTVDLEAIRSGAIRVARHLTHQIGKRVGRPGLSADPADISKYCVVVPRRGETVQRPR